MQQTKRVTIQGIEKSIKKGSTWEDVATEFGFISAEKIRKFVKNKCQVASNLRMSTFNRMDKKARQNTNI